MLSSSLDKSEKLRPLRFPPPPPPAPNPFMPSPSRHPTMQVQTEEHSMGIAALGSGSCNERPRASSAPPIGLSIPRLSRQVDRNTRPIAPRSGDNLMVAHEDPTLRRCSQQGVNAPTAPLLFR